MSELSPAMRRLAQLDRKFGAGATYSKEERLLIVEGRVPEWVFRGTRLLRGPLAERCVKAAKYLQELHDQVWPKVKDADDNG